MAVGFSMDFSAFSELLGGLSTALVLVAASTDLLGGILIVDEFGK